jgi:hypothetical protein
MGNIRHSNNGSATLAAGILGGNTSLTVQGGEGALFPTVGAGLYAKIALEDVSGNIEIVHLTSRAGDVLTVTRAQEGTFALAFASGSRVENRVTAGTLTDFVQGSGDTFAGILDGQNVGQLSNTRINAGQTVGTPIRGDAGVTTNQLVVPSGGGPPTIGGSMVYTVANLTQAVVNGIAFPVGTILLWHGLIGGIPAGFQLCDGSIGTPDLRDKFIVGAGTTYAWQATGGAVSVTSGAGGAHTPTIQVTHLDSSNLPSHTHRLFFFQGNHSGDVDGMGVGATSVAGNTDAPGGGYELNNGAAQRWIENTGSELAVKATGTLTGTTIANTNTVTIGSTVYTFKTVITVAYDVLVGGTDSISLDNLIAAITAGAGAGTLYGTGTVAHPTVTAAAGAGDTMIATALAAGTAGNSIATTETLTAGSWSAATLLGGVDPTGSGHTHTADAVADHTHTVATLPPYYALFFIMKV